MEEFEYSLLEGYERRPYRVKFRTDKIVRTGTFVGCSPQNARDVAAKYLNEHYPNSTILVVYSHKDFWQNHINWENITT